MAGARGGAAGCYLCRSAESKARTEAASLRRRSSVDEERRFSYRKGENESNERETERAVATTVESTKSGKGRQRIAKSHG